jgi:hypothetical protein
MEEKQGLVRVNARIGKQHNDYLDKKSAETGISKSSLIQLAIDSYMLQDTAIRSFEAISQKIDNLEKLIEENTEDEK